MKFIALSNKSISTKEFEALVETEIIVAEHSDGKWTAFLEGWFIQEEKMHNKIIIQSDTAGAAISSFLIKISNSTLFRISDQKTLRIPTVFLIKEGELEKYFNDSKSTASNLAQKEDNTY